MCKQIILSPLQPWSKISLEAKTFIDSLLVNDSAKRLTATEALRHVWMRKRQPKKRNLQGSISSNWTESCLSLNGKFLSNGSISKAKTDTKNEPGKPKKPTECTSNVDHSEKSVKDGTKCAPRSQCSRQTIHVGEKSNDTRNKDGHTGKRNKLYHTLSDGIEANGRGALPPLNNPGTPLLTHNRTLETKYSG